jgi:hypothetical protein
MNANCPTSTYNPKIGQTCKPAMGECELPAVCERGNPQCPQNRYRSGSCNMGCGIKGGSCTGYSAQCRCNY